MYQTIKSRLQGYAKKEHRTLWITNLTQIESLCARWHFNCALVRRENGRIRFLSKSCGCGVSRLASFHIQRSSCCRLRSVPRFPMQANEGEDEFAMPAWLIHALNRVGLDEQLNLVSHLCQCSAPGLACPFFFSRGFSRRLSSRPLLSPLPVSTSYCRWGCSIVVCVVGAVLWSLGRHVR